MTKDTLRQGINLTFFAATFVINVLANALPFNNQSTGEISDRFPVYFVPEGYVFSIWGLIYLLLAIFAVYQALPAQRENPALRRIGYWFALSCVFNSTWMFMWHYNFFGLSLVMMLGLLFSLIMVYTRLGIGVTPAGLAENWIIRLPFQVYLGWITVATIANATNVLYDIGWNGWGVSDEIWMVIMLAAALVIAGIIAWTRQDIPYLLVLIWALVGIALKHEAVTLVATATWAATIGVALLVVVSLIRRNPETT
jgi:hypothetical protein